MHADYGGVVPELASRDHVRRAPCRWPGRSWPRPGSRCSDLDGIAYTAGPGPAGALLVGASVANALGSRWAFPRSGVHHLEGHLLSPLLAHARARLPVRGAAGLGRPQPALRVDGVGRLHACSATPWTMPPARPSTRRPSCWASVIPAARAVARSPSEGGPGAFKLPRPMMDSGDLDFSFSGLKTAVLTAARDAGRSTKMRAAQGRHRARVRGGDRRRAVRNRWPPSSDRPDAARGRGRRRREPALRERLTARARARGCTVLLPRLEFCTDNGAMIAFAGAKRLERSEHKDVLRFGVRPRWPLDELAPPLVPLVTA